MRPITQGIVGVSNSAGIPLDHYISPFNVGFGVVVTGTISYSVQHTFDGINWFNHATVASQSANQNGSYDFPILQIRISGISGTGTAVLTVIQAGQVGG
jgi:hypothetical protein